MFHPPWVQEGTSTAHIAIDVRVTQGGYPGIGRAIEGLVRHLLARESPHRFGLIYDADRPISAGMREAVRSPHHFMPIDAALRSPRDQISVPLRLRQGHIDLYHAPYYGMAVRPGIPYVVALHDTIPVFYPEYWSPAKSRIIRGWQRQVATHAAAVITGSEAAALDISRLYDISRSRIVVTPWGVVEWSAEPREPAGLPRQPYLLCVCTNKPHKNLARLVRAYGRAVNYLATVPDLVIAGRWSDRYPEASVAAQEINAAPAAGTVHMLHDLDDAELRYTYEHALAFVFPSLYEGFGLPVLEAMQAGLPVAASTTPAVAEVCAEAALTFDPEDVAAMAAAIRRLAQEPDLRTTLRAAGAERLAQFTWNTTAAQTLRAYEVALCA